MGSTVTFEKKGRIITTKKPQEIVALSQKVKNRLSPYAQRLEVAGSIRRNQLDRVADIDIVAIPKQDHENIVSTLNQLGKVTQTGDKKIEAYVKGVKVDVVLTSPKSWGAALFYLTGPSGANIGRRRMAKEKGLLLNQEGVFNRKTGRYLAGKTEKDVYKALGKPYKKPEERVY
jgi:DNA polymerase (family X)